ncbi:hypothetical protein LX36DRAFT_383471 [Colletotrichum falcatum]|nr:hypothetical protein LX36DRAFT_383471 [Colletotrichum falcatum]
MTREMCMAPRTRARQLPPSSGTLPFLPIIFMRQHTPSPSHFLAANLGAFLSQKLESSKLDELKSPRLPVRKSRFTTRLWRRPPSSVYSRNDDLVSPLSPDFARGAAPKDRISVSPLSPDFANVAASNMYRSAAAEVSPPSSPEMEAQMKGTATPAQGRNVSPMDSPNIPQLDSAAANGRPDEQQQQQQHPNPEAQQKTNIPMMRRERRRNQEATSYTLRETKSQQRLRIQRETRWDDMTGEPTSQDKGRAGQVRPQEFAQEFGAKMGFGTSPAAMKAMQNAPQTHQTFGDRLRRLRSIGGNQKKQQQTSPDSATAVTEPIDERPPWRGASGRTPIVQPVRDTKPASPLSVPPQGARRAAVGPRLPIAGVTSPLSPVSPSRSETSPRSKTPTTRAVLTSPRQLTASPSPSATRTPPRAQSSYPSPPNSSTDVQSPVHATPDAAAAAAAAAAADGDANAETLQPAPLSGQPQKGAAPTALSLDHDKAIRRKPHRTNPLGLRPPEPSYTSSIYSEQTVRSPTSHEHEKPHPPAIPTVPAPAPPPSPPSRPSSAQHRKPVPVANKAAGQHPLDSNPAAYEAGVSTPVTPRESAEIGSPQSQRSPPHQADGVMNRKRPPVIKPTSPVFGPEQPILISMSSPYKSGAALVQAPTPPPAKAQLPSQRDSLTRTIAPSLFSNAGRPESVWSTSKALPPPPTEMSMSNDRIGYLKARLESLSNRRININRAIKQMTELMPTDHILASQAVLLKREAEKRKVEALKLELAEIQREEYETGLKLHRAYKRMDRNAEYEPTTLWVRRVTN